MIREAIEKVIQHSSLSETEMQTVMNEIMSGETTDAQIASFITALRMKGETIDEITGAARVMREKALKVDLHQDVVIDTCGTGGDRKGTFNVSTAAAFVAAAAGVKVAKHGNRSVSSKSGSADVLEALGIDINADSTKAEYLFRKTGLCFLFAPLYNRAMRYAVGPRKEIGIRTIFNMLGPLTNPAGTKYQLIGVYDVQLTETIARVLHRLGSVTACVVHGSDATDEITLGGTTSISELKDGKVRTYTFDPREYGYTLCSPDDLKGGDAQKNASIMKDILGGAKGPMRDVTEINGAFALYIAGITDTLDKALVSARQTIDSGRALRKLEEFRNASTGDSNP